MLKSATWREDMMMCQGRGGGKEAHEDAGAKATTQGLRAKQKRKVTRFRGGHGGG